MHELGGGRGGQGVRGSGDAPWIMNIKAISAVSILGQFWNGLLLGARAGGRGCAAKGWPGAHG